MHNDKFRILEFGMSSGNNAEFIAKKISDMTHNFEYVGLEHESSFSQSKDIVCSKLSKLNINNFDLKPNTFETFKKLENKADLIIASHCLSFCKPESFYLFMQNITDSVKDGGIFMGELYLDKMGTKFILNQDSAFDLLSGKVDSQGNLISKQNKTPSIFNGFSVEAQLSKNGCLVHFVATKTNCEGTVFTTNNNLVDFSNPKVTESAKRYNDVQKSVEAKENRGNWVNYASIYSSVEMPRPLVQSYFDSEQGTQFLNTQVKTNNINEQQNEDAHSLQQQNINESEQAQNLGEKTEKYENPEAWSIHFNQATEILSKGNPGGVENSNLKESQNLDKISSISKTQDNAPIQ